MLTKTTLEILTWASLGQLPRSIDPHTPGVDVPAFKELYLARYIDAVDVSADFDAYLDPRITLRGREALQAAIAARRPWWQSFDRRIAIAGLCVAVLDLASNLGLLVSK